MKNNGKNKKGAGRIFVVLLIALAAFQCVSAADLPSNRIAGAMHVDINTANSGGYYIKFDGGGLNALHMTTGTSDRYGQLTTTSMESGTFYISDTGGRGFFNNVLLMIAVRKPADDEAPIPDDFSIKFHSDGYKWASTGIKNKPPAMEDIEYVSSAVNQRFSISSLSYGPQKWKPAGNNDPMNYPIYGDQDMSGDEKFYIFFVDLKVGALGENSGLSGLTDNGMVKVEYSIENLNSGLVAFNTYGWCDDNQANQGKGISWTNRVAGTGASGYVVNIVGSGGGEGETPSSGKLTYDSDGSSSSSSPEGWKPEVGNLNISSIPAGAKVYIDNIYSGQETNTSFVDLPAGDYTIQLKLDEYELTDPELITVKSGYVTEENFNLTKGSGSCFVSSLPKGADIFVDGTDTLWHTNSLITAIKSGNHTITVYKEGYQPGSANVTVRMGKRSEISFVSGGDNGSSYTLDKSGYAITNNENPDFSEYKSSPESPDTDAAEVEGTTDLSGNNPVSGEEAGDGDDGIISFILSLFGGIFSGASEESKDLSDIRENASEQWISPTETPNSQKSSESPETPVYNIISGEIYNSSKSSGLNNCKEMTGGLYVTSYPDNLPITLDGVKTEETTPKYFPGLKEGFHKVMVREGLNPQKTAQKTVRVFADDDTCVTLKPRIFSQKIQVNIQSKDFRDSVFLIEGEYPEYKFPSKVYIEKSGTYITVVKDGIFYTFHTGSQDENSAINIKSPDSQKNTGKISLTSTPEGAEVSVDGHRIGFNTPCTIANITEGTHILRIAKDGYYPESKEIRFVNTGKSDDSDFSFTLEEYSYGTLFIDSNPSGCMVYLKGSYTGVKTPHTFEYIPIGSYDVAVAYNRTTFKEGLVTIEPLEKSGVTVYNATLEL